MNRTEAREFVMKCVFQMEGHKEISQEAADKLLINQSFGAQKDYVMTLIHNLCQNIEEIDTIINENSKGWPVTRMPKADLAIIRVAVCEMKYISDIPNAVSINEAVELAKAYGTEQSPKFVNAVLSKIQKL
jgi:N utilization substance protein B